MPWVPATSSTLAAVCAEKLVPAGTDLVVIEFAYNDAPGVEISSPPRRSFELLLRKLLARPSAPALLLLQHYSWWKSFTDGGEAGRFYEPDTLTHLPAFATVRPAAGNCLPCVTEQRFPRTGRRVIGTVGDSEFAA